MADPVIPTQTPSETVTPAAAPAAAPAPAEGAGIAPGTPAGGGLKEAVDSAEDVNFAVEAFEQIGSVGDGEEIEIVETTPPQGESVPQAPVVAPVPVQQPPVVAAPAPEAPAVVAPAVVPGQVAAPAVTPPAAVPKGPLPEEGFAQLRDQLAANRAQVVDIVAKEAYGLTEAEMDEIQMSPNVGIPKLAARIHVNAVQGVLAHVAQQIPLVVNGILEGRQRQADLEGKFYGAWPQLDKGKHDMTVRQLAAAYRHVHPESSFDEMTRMVGSQAVVALGLQQAQAPAAAAPPRQVPFSPATNGGAGGAAVTPSAQNLFTMYDEIIAAEERGDFDH